MASENLPQIVKHYIQAKVLLTDCQQKHFRQVCSACPKYCNCEVYSVYITAWMSLQEAVD